MMGTVVGCFLQAFVNQLNTITWGRVGASGSRVSTVLRFLMQIIPGCRTRGGVDARMCTGVSRSRLRG